jgi:hypothetical protein
LRRRGSRHPARAALADLARSRTAATHAERAAVLGVSRAESVPNLTRRFAAWLATDARVREQLRCLEEELDESGPSANNLKIGLIPWKNAWATPEASLICRDCGEQMEAEE